MVNVNENTFRYYSMPIHNPFYTSERAWFRMDLINISFTVENPETIANIVPEPLVYKGDEISIALGMITERKGTHTEDDPLWDEISIRIPVSYNNEQVTYLCEVFSRKRIQGILMNREVFGYPKVPAKLSVERNGKNCKAKLSDYESNRDMLYFTFKVSKEIPEVKGPPLKGIKKKPPKLIVFKYIPSVTFRSNQADVKQLVEMQYRKTVIHKLIPGEGNIELLEDAPRYLKEAGIVKINKSIYHDLELDLIGGKVFYNYLKGGNI